MPLRTSRFDRKRTSGSGIGSAGVQAVASIPCGSSRVSIGAARRDVREYGTQEVPIHLRNAPTKLMKELGYGTGYQYDHDAEGGIALDQTAFPDAMGERVYYQPVERGMEIKLKEKLDALRAARAQARSNAKRKPNR